MERFVQWIIGGGLALVAGLWLVALQTGSLLGGVGLVLVLLGLGGLANGLWLRIEW